MALTRPAESRLSICLSVCLSASVFCLLDSGSCSDLGSWIYLSLFFNSFFGSSGLDPFGFVFQKQETGSLRERTCVFPYCLLGWWRYADSLVVKWVSAAPGQPGTLARFLCVSQMFLSL